MYYWWSYDQDWIVYYLERKEKSKCELNSGKLRDYEFNLVINMEMNRYALITFRLFKKYWTNIHFSFLGHPKIFWILNLTDTSNYFSLICNTWLEKY